MPPNLVLLSLFSNLEIRLLPGKILYPISTYLFDANFSASHSAFIAAITTAHEPQSYKETSLDDVWNDSMDDQMYALKINETWDITTLPPGKKAIGSCWVYPIKHHSSGKIARYKSSVVALGNHQKEGVDYTDTFAPVAKPMIVRLLLEVAEEVGNSSDGCS